MNKALLIGNGLNQCYTNGIWWGRLLYDLAHSNDVNFNVNNPFPLEFESIANQILLKRREPTEAIFEELKKQTADMLINQYPLENSIHHQFMSLPVDHILTTNYDYMLERTLNSDEKNLGLTQTKETKYSIHRKTKVGSKSFYH